MPANQDGRALDDASRYATDYRLAPPDLEQFFEFGYLPLLAFSADPELAEIRRILAKLFQEKVGFQEGSQFDMLGPDIDPDKMTQPQILNPSQFAPALLQTEHFKRVRDIAKQLLGPQAQFSFDHSIVKPAGSRRATPWHQDEAHHADKLFRYRQVSFWMPLQDTPAAGGCMRYIPRSHRNDIRPHRKLNNDPRVHAMECLPEYCDESRAITEPAEAGTCILHDGRTLHAALPNASSFDRMAYIIAFIGPPILREQPPVQVAVPETARHPANVDRRSYWLRHGGWFTVAVRRLRQGIRSEPSILWTKARLLLLAMFSRRR